MNGGGNACKCNCLHVLPNRWIQVGSLSSIPHEKQGTLEAGGKAILQKKIAPCHTTGKSPGPPWAGG